MTQRSFIVAATVAFATLVALTGCAPAQSSPEATGPQVVDNVAYAPADPKGSEGHLLDIYLPTPRERPFPLIIWSGGTAWLSDQGRATASTLAGMFNPHGYAVAGVSIRSSDQAQFPAQLSDIKGAIRFLRANAARYHLDPKRFGIAGDSSGGWAAAMAAVTGDVATLEGDVGVSGASSKVQAAAAFYPPTDFLQLDPYLPGNCDSSGANPDASFCAADRDSAVSLLLGCPIESCPGRVAAANPIRFVDRDDPPLLLLHGLQDVDIPWQQSKLLFDAVHSVSGRADFVTVPRGQHGQAYWFLTEPTVRSGAQVQSTADGTLDGPHDVDLNPDYLIAFFDRYLD
ncbi:alpha/beta hydrolase fold domain-containing protein [Leifsonia sp. NPDC058248]|uniref:alpha/beta hydrolase fold domain-containing protein n=1 Tax=Leifsonia sp. NPDC058248 TaxID=3346402 RepID=UPI0036D8761E